MNTVHVFQNGKLTNRSQVSISIRPGNVFSMVINRVTGANPCSRCNQRIKQMNNWGWLKCWSNRKTIAAWLADEARRRGHHISNDSALAFLKAAFKEIRSTQ